MRLPLLPPSLLFVFCCLVTISVNGQGLCDRGGGGFTLDKTQGCAPLTVTVANTVPNPILVAYDAAYDGKSPKTQSGPNFTYSLPGLYTILQQGAVSSGQFYACKTVEVFETRVITPQYSSCGGGKIFLSLTDDAILKAYDEVKIEWGDGKTDVWKKGSLLVIEHNYTDVSSNPTVLVTGLYVGKGCNAGRPTSLPISFQQPQLNAIAIKSIEMRGDGTLRINYLGISGVYTDIRYSTNNSNYTTAGRRSSGGLQPFDVKSMVTSQVYQLKLSSEDLCSGKNDSKVYSSMTLSGKSEDGKNILTWSKYPDAAEFTSYDLLRDGTVIKSFTSINDITYTDEDVQCGSYSEYQVIAKLKDVTSTSAPVGVKAEIASPKPIEGAAVTVDGNHLVTIKANVPGAGPNSTYDLTIEKAEAGATLFKKIITLFNESEYSDPDVKTNELSYCYRISYTNSCGQKVPASQPICTILLTKNLTTLNWTTELPILGGISGYDVIQAGSSTAEEVIPVAMNSKYTVQLNAQSDLEYNFHIRATSPDGDFESLSNIINYRRGAGVFVPDAFSPNGDGYNDILEAKSTQLQAFTFSVINRWGQVVFHSEDINNGWDGTIKGENAPVGSYVYKMTFVDDINQTVEKSGTFMLLR
ncbi:T9SS type B sorting domain-containing protein [Dyadobacter aurulentus]|uniref:T9SS type B sorting domain-containing protein n=1 Tax=Dyadobacter sp. UC 10 TaxID=2605428 RepID=UPI0011F38330|nr:gliding motility-associated C-terminal domain-containing protein [Dyadobacter sp. UC 10]KAA0990431.1 gliding motility-associated C-terminal domain-containing protein [Dyadobacter sp. UC 10]